MTSEYVTIDIEVPKSLVDENDVAIEVTIPKRAGRK
jgi:hypothetical protein